MVLSPLKDETCSVVWIDFGDKEEVKKGFVLDVKKDHLKKAIYTLPIKNKWTDFEQALYKLQTEVKFKTFLISKLFVSIL